MTTTTTKTDPVATAEQLLTERRERLEELRDEVAELDEVDQESGKAVALAIAEGGPDAANSLSSTRREFRERLGALHEALPVAEARVYEAEKALQGAKAAEAKAGYAQARHEEERAAEDVEKAVHVAVGALQRLHDAGRRSYEVGLRAGVETSTTYRRRLSARATFVGSQLGDVIADFHVPNAARVNDLGARLRALLPPIPVEGVASVQGFELPIVLGSIEEKKT